MASQEASLLLPEIILRLWCDVVNPNLAEIRSSNQTAVAGTLWNPDPHLRERFCIRRYSRGTGDR